MYTSLIKKNQTIYTVNISEIDIERKHFLVENLFFLDPQYINQPVSVVTLIVY